MSYEVMFFCAETQFFVFCVIATCKKGLKQSIKQIEKCWCCNVCRLSDGNSLSEAIVHPLHIEGMK